MPEVPDVSVVLEQLRLARDELAERIEPLVAARERVEAAIAVLEGPERPAPVSAQAPASAARPAASAAKSGGAPAREPRRAPATRRSPVSVTEDQVLEQVSSDWAAVGPIVRALGCSDFTIRGRLAGLVAEGRVERKGSGAGTRYRRVDVDGDRGEGLSGGEVAAAPTSDPEPATPTVAVSAAPEPRVANPRELVVDKRLVEQIEGVLHRARQPVSARDVAKSLVANIGEVAQQLHVMVGMTEEGDRYPGVRRDAAGNYSLLVGAAADAL